MEGQEEKTELTRLTELQARAYRLILRRDEEVKRFQEAQGRVQAVSAELQSVQAEIAKAQGEG